MPKPIVFPTAAALIAAAGMFTPAAAEGLIRFPDVHRDRVVFTSGGDLWTVAASGGRAQRLTAHSGLELFGKFSPDGRSVAFTGQFDGDEQVYVVSADGGEPRQLTYYPARGPLPSRWGFDHQVYGFSPDGRQVLFRSHRDHWTLSATRLYTVPVAGGMPTVLAPPYAGAGTFSPDGKRLLYSPLFRDFRTWKRYQGGWAQELYIYDLTGKPIQQVTDDPGADRDPMWIGDAVYFASDRSGRLNLYRYDLKSKATTQLTKHTQADVRWPSAGPNGNIVYELDGTLHIFDTKTGADRAIDVVIPDDGLASRPREVSVTGNIESFGLSPNGKRAVLVARGDVFDAPTEHGLTRNLTHSSNAHEREAAWSPDGRYIAFVSDVVGEEEVWLIDRKTGQHRQLTFKSKARIYELQWSPDGRRIAYSDATGTLYVVEVGSRKKTRIARDPEGAMEAYDWSPRGGFLAYTQHQEHDAHTISIWSVDTKRSYVVTDPTFDAFSPTWGTKGDYLFYLSNRDFRPQLGSFDANFVANRETGVFGVALRSDVKNVFAPRDDVVEPEDFAPKKKKKGKASEADKKKDKDDAKGVAAIRKKGFIKIDFDGLGRRVVKAPIKTSNYGALVATPTHLLLGDGGPFFLGRDDNERALKAFEFEKRKLTTLQSGIRSFAISNDRSTLLSRTSKGLSVLKIGKGGADGKPKPLPTKGMVARVIPKEEWLTIFDETWRRFRDYFYVANMHGSDWNALRQRYRPLVQKVRHREELNDLLGQMVAELQVSHAYIAGGDLGLPARPQVALLGGRFELDKKAGRYRIAKLFNGHNEESEYRSPLTEVGVGAKVGDYVLEINGEGLTSNDNPYRLLRRSLNQPVELLINSRPREKGARRVMVQPIGSELNLVYLEWILGNHAKVQAATKGKIGYLHIPNMGASGLREFSKWFHPQVRKEGLIVDVRANGGGFVSQMIIERLRRRLLGTGFARHSQYTYTYPNRVMAGPMVCLVDETSASDGDIFPWAFRASGLGPLIGKRTWGGVVGITGHGPVLDGGSVFVPEFSTNGPDGAYIIEGRGVTPDIEVENDPVAVARGEDPQLERAIKEVLARHAKSKRVPQKPPAAPAPASAR